VTVKICASIIAPSFRDIVRMVTKAEKNGADLLEVRMDYLQELESLKNIRELSSLPMIATNRPLREGGLFNDSEEKRIQILDAAIDLDFDFIDVELSTLTSDVLVQRIKDRGAKVIISYHHQDSTPNLYELNLIFKQELRTRPDICKIVTSAKRFKDNITCLKFVEKAYQRIKVICFSMGELGLTSRLLSPILGGYLTYASVEKGKESALGQLTVADMRSFYNMLGV